MSADEVLPLAGTDQLGESPWWDARDELLWWVDIYGARIRRASLDGTEEAAIATPREVSFAIPGRSGGLVVGLSDSLGLLTGPGDDTRTPDTWTPGAWSPWWHAPFETTQLRLNEGKTDRDGLLWFGSMHRQETQPLGCIYRWDGQEVTEQFGGVLVSNGLGWAPDGETMYFTDSPARRIWAFDYDRGSGETTRRRVFLDDPGPGFPDGLTVDADGCVWSAKWNGGRVVRYTPDGRLDREIALPVAKPTSLCFAGPDLRTLVVTSARIDPGDGERAGSVFLLSPGEQGIAEVPAREAG